MKCHYEGILVFGLYFMIFLRTTHLTFNARCKLRRKTPCSVIRFIHFDLACHVKKSTGPCNKQETLPGKWALLQQSPNKIIRTTSQQIKCGKLTKKKKYKFHPSKLNTESKKLCDAYNKLKTENVKSHCILYRREDIACRPTAMLIPLCLLLKPGMKITLYGGALKTTSKSIVSFTRDSYNPTNVFKWSHIQLHWKTKKIQFTEGLSSDWYKKEFPILDKSQFTFAVNQSETSSQVFVNGIPLKSMKLLKTTYEIHLRNFKKVYLLVVQKTEPECADVKTGLP